MGVRIAFASYGTFEQFIHQIKPFYTDEVSEAEEKIRRKLYTKGFVARTRLWCRVS